MRHSRFTEEQIALAVRQAEAGTPVTEICRKLEITPAGAAKEVPDQSFG